MSAICAEFHMTPTEFFALTWPQYRALAEEAARRIKERARG
jgi:hypothetical protein